MSAQPRFMAHMRFNTPIWAASMLIKVLLLGCLLNVASAKAHESMYAPLGISWDMAAMNEENSASKAVVLIFARNGGNPNAAVRIERDLRNMFDYAHGLDPQGDIPSILPVEPRFDVGNLSKGELTKARMHFDNAQRALEGGDSDEAMEQLFRAERFYNKAIPYSSDTALLRGIFFYYYLARLAAKQEQQSNDAYCAYVALTRNLAGSVGPIEQFEPLADRCGPTSIAGTGELRVTSDVDGAHVYVDDRPVGVVGERIPYVDPFLPAGPHLIEVRKSGYVRFGTLLTLRKGKTESLRARLKPAKNVKDEYSPLADMVYEGKNAYSEDYIADLFFQMAELYGVGTLVVGYLLPTGPAREHQVKLNLFTFNGMLNTQSYVFSDEMDAHRKALQSYWQTQYGQPLDPEEALPTLERFAPTLFKVE